MFIRQWKEAIAQAEPCWFDIKAGVAKTIKLIEEASANGTALIAFSEVWLPEYLNVLWSGTYVENLQNVFNYRKNSITADGPEVISIRRATRENNIYVALGFSERVSGTLYLASMLIGANGDVLRHRRKIKPTHLERTLFSDSLNCWEHLQPLLKYNTWAQGEEVHIAMWPFNGPHLGAEPWSVCSDANELTMSRAYSIEACFRRGQQRNSVGHADTKGSFMHSGGGGCAAVFQPDGRQVTEPTDPEFDGILYCDIDLDQIDYAKATQKP
ncbi:hypothetical protein N7449_011486 [Penicillium cf. viridicatum]|uniref:CN hydrolase domain-containing protein n=1 Tax=Penicillium cf. viridicatum TaxID=2972119 RepID=A0A9W9IZ03_9EURO|nr:hypothetical protein N7449_011486 [Penicillium cf. viridicatum]